MTSWLRTGFLSLVALATLAVPAAAQDPDGTMVFARVANWQIARPHWDAYDANQKKVELPVLEKMLADGVITEYGIVRNAVHTPDGFTHSTWYASKTMAGLEQTLAALIAAAAKLPAAEQRRGNAEFAGTKHSDVIVRSRVVKGKAAKLSSGYGYLSMDLIRPGQVAAHNERYEKLVRPPLDALFASGAVVSFGIDQEFIHTTDPNARTRWVIFADASGLDKWMEATLAANRARTPAERQALGQAGREILAGDSHRDELWEIQAYGSKY
jgi:hypothetical protein